jgi:hypothetical protein
VHVAALHRRGDPGEESQQSRIRSQVEHSIDVVKRVVGFSEGRYSGLARNANWVFVTAALGNVFLVRYTLVGAVRPQLRNKPGRPRCGSPKYRIGFPEGRLDRRFVQWRELTGVSASANA